MSRRRNNFIDDDRQRSSAFFDLSDDDYETTSGESIHIFGESLNRTSHQSSNRGKQHKTVMYDVTRPRPKKKRRSRRKAKPKSSAALLVVLSYAIIGFFVCSLMITRYSYIIEVDEELDMLESEIKQLESVVEEKKLEVSLKDDIGMVQSQARNEHGMYYPKNDQIVYIELEAFENEEQQVEENTVEVLSENFANE